MPSTQPYHLAATSAACPDEKDVEDEELLFHGALMIQQAANRLDVRAQAQAKARSTTRTTQLEEAAAATTARFLHTY